MSRAQAASPCCLRWSAFILYPTILYTSSLCVGSSRLKNIVRTALLDV